jgi:hypothetical protein
VTDQHPPPPDTGTHADLGRRLEQLQTQLDRLREATEANAQAMQRRVEALIEHERYLREIHEQPVTELREHAASLTQVSIATARAAQSGFVRAEARLAAFENDVHRRLNEIAKDLQSAVSELKALPASHLQSPGRSAPWAFEDVTRLHHQLRDPGAVAVDAGGRTDAEPSAARNPPAWRSPRVVSAVLGVLALAASFGAYLQYQVQVAAAHARDAEVRLQQAADAAAQRAAAARDEAAQQISSAREIADRAERMGNVLAAPDLLRYSLHGGTAAPTATGRGLWSRTRGLVFTGTRIPPPPPDGAHQLWLLTRSAPVKVSSFVPGPDGTVTLVDDGPRVPGAVVGIMVTAERVQGADRPSGQLVLSSVAPVE